jgi:hypothetical protein
VEYVLGGKCEFKDKGQLLGNHKSGFLNKDGERPVARVVSRLKGATDQEKFENFMRQQKHYSWFSLVLAVFGLSLLVCCFAVSLMVSFQSNASFAFALAAIMSALPTGVASVMSLMLLRERRLVLIWKGPATTPTELADLQRCKHMNQVSAFAYPASVVLMMLIGAVDIAITH